jgi:hypothetical protein
VAPLQNQEVHGEVRVCYPAPQQGPGHRDRGAAGARAPRACVRACVRVRVRVRACVYWVRGAGQGETHWARARARACARVRACVRARARVRVLPHPAAATASRPCPARPAAQPGAGRPSRGPRAARPRLPTPQVPRANEHYALAAPLPSPLAPAAGGLVVQYEAQTPESHGCGGAYVKLLSHADGWAPGRLSRKTPYSIMFGPDRCGAAARVRARGAARPAGAGVWGVGGIARRRPTIRRRARRRPAGPAARAC